MNTYKILFQPYERFETPAPRVVRFKAPSDKLALLKASPLVSWGCGKFVPEDLEDCLPKDYIEASLEEMVQDISDYNGDGCDFLFFLKNETTGKTIFQDGGYEDCDEVEEWDVELPEELSFLQ